STSEDKTLRVWDVTAGKELRQLPLGAFGRAPSLLAVSPDGKVVALAGPARSGVLGGSATGKELHEVSAAEAPVTRAAFTSYQRPLVIGPVDHPVHRWDLARGGKPRQFAFAQTPDPRQPIAAGGDSGLAYVAALSPDGTLIAYGSQERYLVLQELATGKE